MDQPKIPTLKDSQNKPQVKIKGLSAGLSLFDRLKQFKKKDLAFILAGLGTLFMAPLAEHFMMAPESGDGTMQQGWGGKGGSNLFGSGTSPYESGITGLAPGGAIGGGGDVITPLNVRDPSALVMGPGAQQQPPAGSMAPQTAPPSKEPDLKDALANAAARAAGAATRRAPIPVPKTAITGSGLRGLGVVSGGSSAGASMQPINSAGLSTNKAAGSNSLSSVRPATGYRGAAGARGPGSGSGAAERLKAAAGGAGDIFNRGGGAGSALQEAASAQIPNGALGGAGGGGAGAADKGPGGSNTPGSKSVGESLEFLRQKQEMEKSLDLKWKMKEKKAMFPLELGQEVAKTAVMKGFVEPVAGGIGDLWKNAFTGSGLYIVCEGNWKQPASKVATNSTGCTSGGQQASPASFHWCANTPGAVCACIEQVAARNCRTATLPGGGADAPPAPERGGNPDPYSSVGQYPSGATGRTIDKICTDIKDRSGAIPPQAAGLFNAAKDTALALEAMNGTGNTAVMGACNVTSAEVAAVLGPGTSREVKNVRDMLNNVRANQFNHTQTGVVPNLRDAAAKLKGAADAAKAAANGKIDTASQQIGASDSAGASKTLNELDAAKADAQQLLTQGQQLRNGIEGKFEPIVTSLGQINGALNAIGTKIMNEASYTALGANVPARGPGVAVDPRSIYNDLGQVLARQRTEFTNLRTDHTNLNNSLAKARAANTEGVTHVANATALLGAAAPTFTAAQQQPAAPQTPVSYGQVKTQGLAALGTPGTAVNTLGTLKTNWSASADFVSGQVGAQPTGQTPPASGWTKSIEGIMDPNVAPPQARQ